MTYDDFDEAKGAADDLGLTVAGTLLKSGQPVYFLVSDSISDEEIRALSFEIREGRPMTSYESWALEVAERQRQVQPDYTEYVEQVLAS